MYIYCCASILRKTASCRLKKSDNVHYNVAAKGLKKKIDEIEHLASLPQKEAELSKLNAENEERCRMLEEHAEGVNRLLDWIEGPGEKWLLTLHEIGENKDEARQLVKEHQQLALKSKSSKIVPVFDRKSEKPGKYNTGYNFCPINYFRRNNPSEPNRLLASESYQISSQ
ncbi:hypothetical protein ANCCAN_23731 [Ancylostoma caninum]|uniref:Uncharacterized protein n=1 Tax=Ancylostoma caninum TaxID=29170 RepID=A0A368FI47_ANCCA|nr:hypothetical protein ANCCAN_23731 [Ancylostoma caninum]